MKAYYAAAAGLLLLSAPALAQHSSKSHALNSKDKEFLHMAADGNLAEAGLGTLAQQKGETAAVREFGRWMATDHGFANKRLLAIAEGQNEHLTPKITAKDKALQTDLERLSGKQFDEHYLKAMVEDHQKTIKQFKLEAQNGQDHQIKEYAEHVLPLLEQHLAEAEQLAGASGVAMRTDTGTASGSSTPPRTKTR